LLGIADFSRRDLGTPVGTAAADEGMLLIEDILLRAGDFVDPHPAICRDTSCAPCVDDDPYSYRIHILLPAHSGRFAEMPFRQFAEEVIRQETPAHILPRICWVDPTHMHDVETKYSAWLEARATTPAPGDLGAKLGALLDALAKARNVYPTVGLTDCAPGDDPGKAHFVVDQTRLASDPQPPT
jgi:hypothetical protein